ncbi:hypothetical protein HRR83_003169 [Exophiala dermatitidis]|nr:hypothetical protein HRR73_008087 [Exophiala dermatitidis]KAJ4506870.1 hypothetical protein HRR74_008186 [Exophiala dermatitidis]KAJ4578137.1 hypothetical protein HRR79_001454 [Exophiala dermatitidis]KAJ4580221.1 hypothetical protein HRR81_002385 [Exophiala dermatitidis]KAJ4598403.1 hypothetical protein HRR84_003777 [Exophiala dermatitidis]
MNLLNYNDIREACGVKNIVFQCMNANNSPDRPRHYGDPFEMRAFGSCNHIVRFLVTSIHELLGHGTDKFLAETAPGTYKLIQFRSAESSHQSDHREARGDLVSARPHLDRGVWQTGHLG